VRGAAGVVKYLVFCSCGHSLERHGADGCAGADAPQPLPCPCPKDQAAALDAAIAEARTHPWGKIAAEA
jgi:hypothetical protein